MKSRFLMICTLGVGAAVFSAPLAAHHGNASYETEKRVTLKGTITQWLWSNPHCVLALDVTDDSGQVVHWVFETENPSSMIRSGWNKDSLKVGDQVTVTALPLKDGRPVGRISEIVFANGQKLLGRGIPPIDAKPDEYAKP